MQLDLGEEPLPEGLFWLLLTGDIPTEAQVNIPKEGIFTQKIRPKFSMRGAGD